MGRRTLRVLGAAFITSVLAGTTTAAARTTTTTTTTTAVPAAPACDPTASLRPTGPVPTPGQMPAGSAMGKIQQSGYLRVGVDENTIGFSARNPETGEISGFEADLARAIAAELFGDDKHVKLVTVTTPEKISAVKDGLVDMTISVVTMDCKRWQDVDFTSAYYTAAQRVLVREDSQIRSQADLPGKRICVTEGSSSQSYVVSNVPDAKVVRVPTRTACLVKLQDNKVDAILLPSSILAGLKVQDPTTRFLPGALVTKSGVPTTNNYGIAINKANPDLVRYVNALLERWRSDGTLLALEQPVVDVGLPTSVPDPSYQD